MAAAGELCEGGGECGTDDDANNCRGADKPDQPFSWRDRPHSDVYRVLPCDRGGAIATGGTSGAAIAVAVMARLLPGP